MRSGSGDDGHDRGDDRGLDFASKEPRSRHDRVMIAPRSWCLYILYLPFDEDQVSGWSRSSPIECRPIHDCRPCDADPTIQMPR